MTGALSVVFSTQQFNLSDGQRGITMTTITIDRNTVEVREGGSVYCSNPDAYIEWEELSPAEQETMVKLKNQIDKSTGELSAFISAIHMNQAA